jgi:magnesium transporter
MITIYKNGENGLQPLAEPASGCWINVCDPTPEEISRIQSLGIPQDYIQYPLDLDELSRTERDENVILIIFRVPFFQGENSDVPYITIPLGIIMTEQFILTICKLQPEILKDFVSGQVKDLSTGKRIRFVLRLLLAAANQYLSSLREITKTVDKVEDTLQLSIRNKEVLELLKYQKSLTYFATALKSNELMVERLGHSRLFHTYPDDEDLLEDVLTENKQAIEMVTISSNILISSMDAFASIISNNLNSVMKFLASVTIILSLPTMVASFFGMNVHIPLEDHPYAFFATLAFSIVLALVAVYIFWKHDWL